MYRFRSNRPIDADEIIPNLWQGACPPIGSKLHENGFDVLALCADDNQPDDKIFDYLNTVIRGELLDEHHIIHAFEIMHAERMAHIIIAKLKQDKKCLVTCVAGLNRSGLVCGLVLHYMNGWSGERCVEHIRARRQGAFSNEAYVQYLCSK